MSPQLLLLLIGGLVILLIFAGLTWLFVWISRNNPNTPLDAAQVQNLKGPRDSMPPPTSASQPGPNRAARRRRD
ncbi:hypothetical protein MF271_13790 [Deinococcus sp. KNUC1210]|uniref:hypothetical protein n=1 Tax=Deinococcus sp. KNUC1210 TaxID=2917691 RepID=UPI001EF0ADB5|nr:hypothetical protein [Deinococcus sp. KNUC1210]ULH15021.1 hypothetical protein MF271_13790 [Deinococcus sp. KNUC1210]